MTFGSVGIVLVRLTSLFVIGSKRKVLHQLKDAKNIRLFNKSDRLLVVLGLIYTSKAKNLEEFLATVSITVAACNEVKFIEHRTLASAKSDFPSDRFEIVIVTDAGSTDGTLPVVAETASQGMIRHLHCPNRSKNFNSNLK